MPLPAFAAKYLIGEAMDRMGANKDLKGFVTGPKGYLLDKMKGAADEAAGVMPGTTNAIMNPKAAAMDAAKDYATNKVRESFSDRSPSPDYTPFENSGDYDGMSFGEGEYKRGGKVKSKAAFKQPKSSSASRRGDGIAQRGKTKGRYV
jgi:hypothetical protein